ncbi:uncharacterized protein LOC143626662 [Bidens hawaiensis]|uniref:uncharacterized protein LOC143626662 n=1 Tax=Bidens hawaiensis TaxID=980011 RepID=UPI004049AD71
MGRGEWLYKASGGVDGGRRSPADSKPMNRKKIKDKNTSGCMSVIFNMFDVQHHQFRFHHPSFMPESTVDVAPVSSKVKEESNLKLPMGKIQIKTKRMTFTDELSECSSSPGTKTPNLVARLMGLDILPEYSSPRASSSSTPATSHHHTRSLPTTPRMSTVSRWSTDNIDHNHHHRLSLQINKENYNNKSNSNNNNNSNNNVGQRRLDIMVNRQVDHLKTQYAKEITNQISRRLGTDITNTLSTAKSIDRRIDSDLVLLKPKKDPTVKLSKPVKDEKIKRIASEIRYDLRLKNTTKKKSTALPKHVLNVKNTTKVGCYKREMTSSSSTARSSQLKVSLPSKLNSSFKDVTHKPKTSTVTTTTTSVAKGGSILQRLREIWGGVRVSCWRRRMRKRRRI